MSLYRLCRIRKGLKSTAAAFDLNELEWHCAVMLKRFLLLFFLALPAAAAPLSVATLDGRELVFDVAVADTSEEQKRGLMFVQEMKPQHGMVFPLQPPRIARFWMRNTLLPLDMIFILPGGMIGQIVTRTDTQSDKPTRSHQKVSAVLEINAGEAQRLKIGVGDLVRMEGVNF